MENITNKICGWSIYAYSADILLEQFVDDFKSVFETRTAFRDYKKVITDAIYEKGLPPDVKSLYDYTTSIMGDKVVYTLDWKQKRNAIQARVSRLLGKLENAIFGPAIDLSNTPRRKSNTPRSPVSVDAPPSPVDDTPPSTPKVEVPKRRGIIVDNEEDDFTGEDDDEDEDEEEVVVVEKTEEVKVVEEYAELPIKLSTPILVIGDQCRYDYLIEEGFTHVIYRQELSMMGDEEFEIMFYKCY